MPTDEPGAAGTSVLRTWFRSGDATDRAFAVGIMLKGLNGLLELVGGIVLLFLTRDRVSALVTALTSRELAEDPHDAIATTLLHLSSSQSLSDAGLRFAGIYLVAHGVVKVVLVVAVLRDRIWAYPWMIAFLVAFIGYQLYRIQVDPTAALIALTAFDIVLTWLTYREWRRHTPGR
jgi:uncharacterized membrane protein